MHYEHCSIAEGKIVGSAKLRGAREGPIDVISGGLEVSCPADICLVGPIREGLAGF
jgi:hypothetical protein